MSEPCEPPEELRQFPEKIAAQRIHHLQHSLKFLAEIARSFGFANRKQEPNEQMIGRVLREQAAEVAALRAERGAAVDDHSKAVRVMMDYVAEARTLRARVAELEASLGKIANLYEVVWDEPPPEGDGHPLFARPRSQPTEAARIARAALGGTDGR